MIEHLAQRIAASVSDQEMKFCRKIGMSEFDAAVQGFRVLDETYLNCFAPDRPAVHMAPRIIVGKGR